MNQKEFCQQIVLIALALCFERQTEKLTIEQLLARGFTPLDEYCRACITSLVDSKLIQVETYEPIIPIGHVKKTLIIECPSLLEKIDRDEYIYSKTLEIKELIGSSVEYTLYLRTFVRELYACECIEYAEYCASRSNLQIINASPHDLKLRVLVSECQVEQIRMLLWRAIKKLEQKCTPEQRNIEFSALVQTALNCYITYKRSKREIERYSQPQALKTSVLVGLLESYLGESTSVSSVL
jgi:hypothetical protein